MRNKFISCILSVTLVANSVLPYVSAYADEVEQENAVVVAENMEQLESEVVETGDSEGVIEDGLGDSAAILELLPTDSSGVYLGLPSSGQGIEEGTEEEGAGEALELSPVEAPYPTSPDAYPSYNPNSRALPAIVAWLSAAGVVASAVSKISNLFKSGDPSDEETLLYGILSALVDDGGVLDYIDSLESYGYNTQVHASNIYNKLVEVYSRIGTTNTRLATVYDRLAYQPSSYSYSAAELLYYVMGNLEYTSGGTTYSAARLLYLIRNGVNSLIANTAYTEDDYSFTIGESLYYLMRNSEYSADGTTYSFARSLYNIRQFLRYTDANGTVFTAGSLLYGVRDRLTTLRDDTSSIKNYLRFTSDTGGVYTAASLLYGLRERLNWIRDDLAELYDMLHAYINTEDEDIEVIVKSNPSSDAFDNSTFFDELIGSLDTVALATKLDELTLLLQKAFPFCLVFGIAAIINLLIAPATAPSFDFPLPDGSGGTFLYTVDLSPFDPVAGVFRGMITIIYILGLIRITHAFIFKGGAEQ